MDKLEEIRLDNKILRRALLDTFSLVLESKIIMYHNSDLHYLGKIEKRLMDCIEKIEYYKLKD